MTITAFLHAIETDSALSASAAALDGDLDALLSMAAESGHDVDADALRAAIERDTSLVCGHPAVYLA